MKKGLMYFWKDGLVVEVDIEALHITAEFIRNNFYSCPCIDTAYKQTRNRYGFYDSTGWNVKPLETFPAEFKASLLLMGVQL